MKTKNETLREITWDVLNSIDVKNPPPPVEIEKMILDRTAVVFAVNNEVREKGMKWKIPEFLHPSQIADILSYLHPVRKIQTAGDNADEDYDLLGMYMDEGSDEGIYSTGEDVFRNLIRKYHYMASDKDIKETISALRDKVKRVKRCEDKDLIAVNNGIFDYRNKTLLPFSEKLVFLTKSHVDYVKDSQNVVIHNPLDNTDWDVETWMSELSDDPEITEVLWEILGAIIRPFVPWNKSAWLYSEKGNNGKGTLCELMRNLCGEGTYASIPISEFGKDFQLEPLVRASSIIVDENDVGTFIDKAANLKAVITNDVIQINRKFKTPIAYKFYGFMVQCLNELPRIKDKSDSFYRRQLFIPMTKCFTGRERKYIKNDYLKRPEVLQYVLYRVLSGNYYSLSEPQSSKDTLSYYKEFNDPVKQFVDEVFPQFTWDLLPYTFLYDLYKSWFNVNSPSGGILGRNTFIKDLNLSLPPDWKDPFEGKYPKGVIRRSDKMEGAEPLIIEYNLKEWMNPTCRTGDPDILARPVLKDTYKGIIRKK